MGGGKGGSPAAPDYAGAATEQGEQNRKTFLEGLNATRINQSGPFGSQNWVYSGAGRGARPTLDTFQSKIGTKWGDVGGAAYDEFLAEMDGRRPPEGGYWGNKRNEIINGGIDTAYYNDEAARYDYEQALKDWEAGGTGGGEPGAWTLQTTLSPKMQQIHDIGYGSYIDASKKLTSNPLDTSNLTAGGDWSQLTGALANDGSKYTDAYYNKATRLLGDRYDQDQQALRSQLLNSGLSEGTEAYNNQMTQFMDAKNRNYADITDQAILTGGTLRQQDIQSLVSALSAQDRARAGDLQEASYLRNLPLADAQMILQGLQVPQFSGGQGQGGGFQAGDFQSALSNQFQADMNRWNADAAQQQNTVNTGLSLATLAYLMA